MAVCFCVSMPRKMLCIGKDPILLKSFHVGHRSLGNSIFIFTKGPKADDRIFGIGVDIYHRGKIHMHAQYLKLPGDFCPHFLN